MLLLSLFEKSGKNGAINRKKKKKIFFSQVEKLVEVRISKGNRQFLVRWKGYGESADTWENEKDLNCPQLIEKFLANEEEEETKSTKTGSTKTDKSKKSKASPKKQNENGISLINHFILKYSL